MLYNMSDVEKRYTMVIYLPVLNGDIAGVAMFPGISQVAVPFLPDEMIVRQISYCSGTDAEAEFPYLVYMDAPVNAFIASFTFGTVIQLDSRFLLYGQTVPNQITFRIYECDGKTIISSLAGSLVIHLEYIKYKVKRLK